ncbi:MAG: hypothetical protein R2818_07805 [Flavobacteriales bacterium]
MKMFMMRAKVSRLFFLGVAEEEGLGTHAESLDEERDEHGQLVAGTVDPDPYRRCPQARGTSG